MELLVTASARHTDFSLGKRCEKSTGKVNDFGSVAVEEERRSNLLSAFVSAGFNRGALEYPYLITSPVTTSRLPTPSKTCCRSLEWALLWPKPGRGTSTAGIWTGLQIATLDRNAAALNDIP